MEANIKVNCVSCPICLELPENEVYQCENGHVICARCKLGVQECPQCRVAFGDKPQRNRVAEEILEVILVPCSYKSAGCAETIKRKDLPAHRQRCAFRPVTLCSTLGFSQCEMVVTTGDELRKHLLDIHRTHIFMINQRTMRWPTVLSTYAVGPRQWSYIWRHSTDDSGMFMTHTKISMVEGNATFSSVIIHLGDGVVPKKMKKRCYMATLKVIMICQGQKKCVGTWTGPPLPFKTAEDPSAINYLSIPINFMKSQLEPDQKDFDLVLDFNVEVQKKKE